MVIARGSSLDARLSGLQWRRRFVADAAANLSRSASVWLALNSIAVLHDYLLNSRINMNQKQFATEVTVALQRAGFTTYWAGGCVRDAILGREPKDYDVATIATPDQVRELFGFKRTLAIGCLLYTSPSPRDRG